MPATRILITGGAGFVGSNLGTMFRRSSPDVDVIALDNLRRRGSELNLPRLRAEGITFIQGDVRSPDDLAALPDFNLLIDCAAEPAVTAGSQGSPREVLDINLMGTINCLEAARERRAAFLFLSTSRVHPIAPLNDIPFREEATRFVWEPRGAPGISEQGVTESFPLEGARSFYGAAKLAGELIAREYHHSHGLPVLINRCGVLAGPWQMGKVDQGVIALWVARHYFGGELSYIGFGGTGKQVRDVLHVADLFDLVSKQWRSPHLWDGRVYHVGGGNERSLSLRELTDLCQQATGRTLTLGSVPQTHPLDVRIYISDSSRVQQDCGWRPRRSCERIVGDIHDWIRDHEVLLRPLFT